MTSAADTDPTEADPGLEPADEAVAQAESLSTQARLEAARRLLRPGGPVALASRCDIVASSSTAQDLRSQARLRLATSVFTDFGAGADVDCAYDDAVARADERFGSSGAIPTVAGSDPASMLVPAAGQVPALSLAAAQLRATALWAGHGAPALLAIPVRANSAFTRRRSRIVIDTADPVTDWLDIPGSLTVLPEELEALLGQLSSAQPEERLESVVVTAARVAVTVSAVRTQVKGSSNRFVVQDCNGQVISAGHLSASEARRAAVASIRDAAREHRRVLDDQPLSGLELQVRKLTGRPDDLPLLTVTAAARRTRRVVKLVSISAKPTPAKVSGWLFIGHSA